jgi:hypothetical protein
MSVPGPARTLPRLRHSLKVVVHDGWRGEVLDLSALGLRVRCVLEMPVGALFEGELLLEDGRTLPLRGEVVWSVAPDHVAGLPGELGVRLNEVPEAYTRLLSSLFAAE